MEMKDDFAANPLSDAILDASAMSMRRALGIADDDRRPDLLKALQAAKYARSPALYGLCVNVIPDDEMAQVDAAAEAFVDFDPPRFCISQSGMEQLKACNPRTIFTGSHELSHLWLGHRGLRRFRKLGPSERLKGVPPYMSGERQADRHAAYFLMPTMLVADYRSVEDLMRDFGVSRRAAEVRLEEILRVAPKESPVEVVKFLAHSRGLPATSVGNNSKQRAEAIELRLWDRAAVAPGHDPDQHRLCSKGYLIARGHHLKHRSPFGWCERDGLIKSYRDINRLGIGETGFHDYSDAPCPHCGNFTVSRQADELSCFTCRRKV